MSRPEHLDRDADPGREPGTDALKAAARELWGEDWRIVKHHWADGDVDRFAEHIVGIVDEDERGPIYERRRLIINPDGDEVQVRRERVRSPTVVETTEHERATDRT